MHCENASKPLIAQVKSYNWPAHEATHNISGGGRWKMDNVAEKK
jgi:hypothetical protein